jgi:hypothetical protein
MKKKALSKRFVICTRNEEYKASLEVRKIYVAMPDDKASNLHLLRIMDESGTDYLYPEDYFVSIDLPHTTEEALLKTG